MGRKSGEKVVGLKVEKGEGLSVGRRVKCREIKGGEKGRVKGGQIKNVNMGKGWKEGEG